MGRCWTFLLKWLLIIGLSVLVFELCCDSLVEFVLFHSHDTKLNAKRRDQIVNYERSLIAWANIGQSLHTKNISIETIQERNDLQLIGGQIFFRHGARTPLKLLPNFEQVFQ